jgi:glucose-1-phosphate adenylyltransferase
MSAYEDGKIWKFSEKPKNPDSTRASMGIYIFNKKKLAEYLIADEADENSSKDFGKNIIPNMLAAGEKLYAYSFQGYWKDVGTISSLWEANMDMIGSKPTLDLNDEKWRIYARHFARAPQYVGDKGVVDNSTITEGCKIYGTVRGSVLGPGVTVAEGASVIDSVIMEDVTIGEGATIEYSIIDARVNIGKNAKVGGPKGGEIAVIGADIKVEDGAVIEPGAMVNPE